MHRLYYTQKIPLTLKESWNFFSSPKNLQLLTPAYLGFQMLFADISETTYAGQIIGYKIFPLGPFLPLTWITEITQLKELDYFIDEQRFGPYRFWHHEHRFKEINNGTEIIDIIYYELPLGPIGKLLHTLKVKKDLEKIFTYRREKLESLYGKYKEK